MRISLSLILFSLFAMNVNAQSSQWFNLGTGLKVIDGEYGIGLNGKFSFEIKSIYLELNPLDFTFIPDGTNPNYRRESNSVCRDVRNGHFADSENCATRYKTYYGISSTVNYLFRSEETVLYVGPGFRLGKITTPFFNAGVIFTQRPFQKAGFWYGKIAAGKSFFEVSLGGSLRL